VTDSRSYDKGWVDGKVAQQLHEHAEHLLKINGSTEKVASELVSIRLLIQQVVDLAEHRTESAKAEQDARDKEVTVVAAALEKKEEARRDSSASRWTPVNRWMAVLVALAVVAGAVVTIIATR
jgi:hypothetical protein